MKTSTTIIVSALVAVLASYTTVKIVLPDTTHGQQKKESAYDRVIRTGILRCGYAPSPPQLMKDPNTGKLTGVDYDTWESIGTLLGLKIEWAEEAGWGNFIEGLRSNRYDAFCGALWADEGRSKYLSLTIPFIYSVVNAYVRADDMRFDGNLDKLNNAQYTLPAVDGDVTTMMLKTGFPKAKRIVLPQTSTLSDLFMSVISGKADATFVDPSTFSSFEKDNKGKLRMVENAPHPFIFASYYGVKAGEVELRDMINTALRSMIDDGRLEKIAHSYAPGYMIANKNFEEIEGQK